MSQEKATLLLSSFLIYFVFLHYVSDAQSNTSIADVSFTVSQQQSSSIVSSVMTASSSMPAVSISASGDGSMTSTSSSGLQNESSSRGTTPDATPISMISTTRIQQFTEIATDSVAVMTTPIATSPTPPEDASSVLELIEENWPALAIGLGIGLLVGCCGCCLPLICLFCRRKREVYTLESEKKKPQAHVRFQEKTTVRVEEIPLESADNDKDVCKKDDTSKEEENEPLLTKEEKQKSPSDVVVIATADAAKETAMKDKEENKANLSKEDSASKEPSDSQGATSSDTTSSTVKDKSPSKNEGKGKKTSSEKDKAPSDSKGPTPSSDTEKAEDLHAKQTGLSGTSPTKTSPADEKAKAAMNVKDEKTAHTPTPEKGPQQQTDSSPKQGTATSTEDTTSGAAQSEMAAKLEQQQPKQSKTIPGGDEIDALLKDVLNWELQS